MDEPDNLPIDEEPSVDEESLDENVSEPEMTDDASDASNDVKEEVHPANQKKIYREEKLIRYIAENLVNEPDEVSITRQRKGRTIVLELNVASGDMGRVIGRSGKVANAMRSLLRSMSGGRQRIVLDIE
ncbi:MAG: KH domain-containing protein [Aggregatilineales bacterium]